MVGDRVFTQQDRTRGVGWSADAVGMGAFWFDSVVVDRAVYPVEHGRGRLLNEGNYDKYSPHTPFDLPYWLLLPPTSARNPSPQTVSEPPTPHSRSHDHHAPLNLLSVCAPSASHVGFSSLRLEPTLMVLGQAAGAAASLAAGSRGGVHLDAEGVSRLRTILRGQGQRVLEEDLGEDDWKPCGVK